MDETRPSLLVRVKRRDDQTAWREFYKLYNPLLNRFARARGLGREEADDVAQECMNVLVKKMSTFNYSRGKGKFKNFLFTLASNQINDRLRRKRPRTAASGELERLEARDQDSEHEWDQHWLRQHLAYCLKNIESDFAESTIAAFKLYALREWKIEKVCESLDLTPNQVYLAKTRVTRRLRRELTDMVGDVL